MKAQRLRRDKLVGFRLTIVLDGMTKNVVFFKILSASWYMMFNTLSDDL